MRCLPIRGVAAQHLLFLTGMAAVTVLLGSTAWAAGGGHDGGHEGVNWFYGIIGESDAIDHPTFLYRTVGMPVPLVANLFNTAVLFGLLYKFGREPIMAGLAKRREDIMRGIDDASKMRAEAAEQLEGYEAKLQAIDSEITRIRTEMREAAQAERALILAEAKKRRERMERDVKHMIGQELKQAREQLHEQTVKAAMEDARKMLVHAASDSDHERLCEEYLKTVQSQLPNVPGGRA